MSLPFAQPADAKSIYKVFQAYPDVFPHLRFDALQRRIAANECLWQNGVVLTFHDYKRKTWLGSHCLCPAGTTVLHQIAKDPDTDSEDVHELWDYFVYTHIQSDHHLNNTLVLTVRENNIRAREFYHKKGLKDHSRIEWSEKGMPLHGVVYTRQYVPWRLQ